MLLVPIDIVAEVVKGSQRTLITACANGALRGSAGAQSSAAATGSLPPSKRPTDQRIWLTFVYSCNLYGKSRLARTITTLALEKFLVLGILGCLLFFFPLLLAGFLHSLHLLLSLHLAVELEAGRRVLIDRKLPPNEDQGQRDQISHGHCSGPFGFKPERRSVHAAVLHRECVVERYEKGRLAD